MTSAIHHQVYVSPATVVALRNCGHCHVLCEVSRYIAHIQFRAHLPSTKEYSGDLKGQQSGWLISISSSSTRNAILKCWNSIGVGFWHLRGFAIFSDWTKQIICGKCQGLEVGNLPFSDFYKANKRDPGFLTQGQPWCQTVNHGETTVP